PRETTFVLIYDPKDLAEVNLEALKLGFAFEDMQLSLDEQQTLVVSSTGQSIRVLIRSSRLEFVQDLRSPFEDRAIDGFGKLIKALPELSVKAVGVNLTVAFTVSGYERAGLFVRDRFLVQPTKLEQVLGKQVFATSVRLL